jgi:hypothetical protein
MDNKIIIEGKCQVHLMYKSLGKFALAESITYLDCDDRNVGNQFYDEDGKMNKTGVQMLSTAFIQGLKSSMERGAANGVWDKEEHFLWIHKELLRVFPLKTTVADIEEEGVDGGG